MKKYLLVFVLLVGGLFNAFSQDTTKANIEKDYDIGQIQEMPEFPGGHQKMIEYFQNNLTYPKSAIKRGCKGRVIVGFSVEKSGQLSNIVILKKSSKDKLIANENEMVGYDDLDNEALRLVKEMPYWTPGKYNEKPVKSRSINLPVSFNLE
jgi:TonB family protein